MAAVTRPRLALLDGLRGVAALFVIIYHFGEAFATSPETQWLNHGYLAVDFFFILSGFVLGYAYDSRWAKGLTSRKFILLRIIRLHPMVVLAVLLGGVAYIIQGSVRWDGTPMPVEALLLSLFLGLLMLPALPGSMADVRGNNEMFPLNGPSWSLFFEYIGSIMYALWLRRLSVRYLRLVVLLSAVGIIAVALGNMSGYYHIGVGWTLCDYGFFGGFARLSFSFSVGLLMSRNFKPIKVRGAFWICSAIMGCLFAVPYIGADTMPWLNACFDIFCTLFIFPLIVYIGASGAMTDSRHTRSARICEFLGMLSYPVYMIHYPVMYLFYSWVWSESLAFEDVWPVCTVIFIALPLLAALVARYYDMPLRSLLVKRFAGDKKVINTD